MVLSGGTGTPKLLLGLKELLRPEELSVVVNTAEDLWISGNYISPDIDSVLYTLADMIDEKKWWGIKGDKTLTHDFLIAMGIKEKLQVGDKDRAVHIFRSELLRRGVRLASAIASPGRVSGGQAAGRSHDGRHCLYRVSTPEGVMHFQEYLGWLARGARGAFHVVAGMDAALPSARHSWICWKRRIPFSSVPAILSPASAPFWPCRACASGCRHKMVVAVSPFIGNKPVSGPAAKFMAACGVPANDEGVR